MNIEDYPVYRRFRIHEATRLQWDHYRRASGGKFSDGTPLPTFEELHADREKYKDLEFVDLVLP